MSKSKGKARAAGSRGFGSPAPGGFGGFSIGSSGSSLSYLSEPPDFSAISDANVVVSFKNLLKKDSTTKAKALEDLVAYTQAHPYEQNGGAEEAVLEVWVQLYPRISIDNSRRVRELSHTLQLELVKSARKRMERRIPKIVGSWLAGTFDKDRVVARAASDGLSSFLNTEEKVTQFWKKCQIQILDFAIEAIQETPDTLSDERSTTADDSEAKYLRVVSGSLSLVLGLLQRLQDTDMEVADDKYDEFLAVEAVWACATANDALVRRTVFQLLWTCLERRDEFLTSQLPRLSKILISEGLKTSQTGSAMEYVTVLTKLTEKHAKVWGTKKSPLTRLLGFLERGSQFSSPNFWDRLQKLLATLPQETVTFDEAKDALRALRAGITIREQQQQNVPKAWACYLNTFTRFLHIVTPEASRAKLAAESLFPLTEHYIFPQDKSSWPISAQTSILSTAYSTAAQSGFPDVVTALEQEWIRLADTLVMHLSNSLPEVSKDFQDSQRKVASEGQKWFTLVGIIRADLTKITGSNTSNTQDATLNPSTKIISNAVDLLKRRNYKPFGAAIILLSALESTPHIFQGETALLLPSLFPPGEVSTLLASPSVSYLLSSINCVSSINQELYESIWITTIKALLDHDTDANALSGITRLVSQVPASSLSQSHPDLQGYLVKRCIGFAQGQDESFGLFEAAFTWGSLAENNAKTVAQAVIDLLDKPSLTSGESFKAIEVILARQPGIIMSDEDLHLALVAKLLALTEMTDPAISTKASALRSLMEKRASGQPLILSILEENLEQAGPRSLEIDTLVQQAVSMSKDAEVAPERLFPSTNVWMRELLNILQAGLSPSLSLTSNFSGAYYLPKSPKASPGSRLQRDRNGASVPSRMALYTSKLLSSGIDISTLPQTFQAELLYLLYLVSEIASDQLALMGEQGLWLKLSSTDLVSGIEDFISSTRKILSSMMVEAKNWRPGSGTSVLDELIATMLREASALSPLGLYSAKALSELLQAFSETHGLRPGDEEWVAKLDVMKASPTTVFPAIAILIGYGESISSSKAVTNLLNRLVSDVAGAQPHAEKTMITLVLLNACMSVYEIGELPVANNRLVFAVKQITSWLEDAQVVEPYLAAEACRSLQRLLPCIKDVYGPYWERSIEFSMHLWDKAGADPVDVRLSYVHASLKLVSVLEAIEEPNDDLEDAIKELAYLKSGALINLLLLPRDGSNSQPADIVDALLCRMAEKIPLKYVKDLSELYGVIASDSRDVQTAAFSLLHRALPAAQEQISLDVLLEKKDARLPDELLSLLLEAPTLEAYPDDVLVHFPTPVRSYLLSWHLIFDAYSKASYKVRNDYTENLKAANYAGPLLEFTFDVLGHSASHPLNLDKEGFTLDYIQSYNVKLGEAEPEEKNMHWLLVHLYYLTLKYIPGLFRSWFIDCRSKQTKIAVESWMTKYFSPIIISETLDEVDEWAQSQDAPADDEKELMVKVSRAGKEVTAGYEVDELQASIAIKIPPSYPLEGVTVVGVNRVAVNEKKWQSWLMTTQGVITFSNGSIIDGLTTFRRNVVGALKGQSECAICYSTISTDKKMPDKRCQTCKNLFHRTCLYKWFQTSNQNTCPLCRNPIDYLGADTKSRRGGPA